MQHITIDIRANGRVIVSGLESTAKVTVRQVKVSKKITSPRKKK